MQQSVKQNLTEFSGCVTSYQGVVNANYADLVKVFGEPHELNGDKTLAEWSFKETETGDVFTIYDYKNFGLSKEFIRAWTIISGADNKAVNLFYKYFDSE